MINYTWTIAALEYATEENSLNKVVKTVHWRYRGTDETSGISYELFGAQAMDEPNTAVYIPYDELTEATVVLTWRTALGKSEVAIKTISKSIRSETKLRASSSKSKSKSV